MDVKMPDKTIAPFNSPLVLPATTSSAPAAKEKTLSLSSEESAITSPSTRLPVDHSKLNSTVGSTVRSFLFFFDRYDNLT